MSFLKNLKEVPPIVKQIVKQKTPKKEIVKQSQPKREAQPKKESLKLNPNVKSIADIPNTNIMTIGNLLGIRLRDKKRPMLRQLNKHINNLLSGEKNDKK